MMMAGKPKAKLASVIMGHVAKPSFAQGIGEPSSAEPIDMEKPQEDASMGLEASAEKMMKAFESKDVKSLVSALQDFISMSDSDDGEE